LMLAHWIARMLRDPVSVLFLMSAALLSGRMAIPM